MGKIRKECEICGKFFGTKSQLRKYCSKRCRAEAIQIKRDEKGQKCWLCKNAIGNCSWSKDFTPVEGWGAKEVTHIEKDGYIRNTYEIFSCPKFALKENT